MLVPVKRRRLQLKQARHKRNWHEEQKDGGPHAMYGSGMHELPPSMPERTAPQAAVPETPEPEAVAGPGAMSRASGDESGESEGESDSEEELETVLGREGFEVPAPGYDTSSESDDEEDRVGFEENAIVEDASDGEKEDTSESEEDDSAKRVELPAIVGFRQRRPSRKALESASISELPVAKRTKREVSRDIFDVTWAVQRGRSKRKQA
ncbi:hypothetical protein KFL_001650050 [Klebsormidium nitens]|uniref:Uncharacterized protein n=1 Tax=Klebsormidium nitens TaxID=105231 RepID=A0A1Y1I080_KLENI|nr:hypothetical protein KFL_001650050 [Klebsormidium nitens]|eukprot:GAQ83853.1 hypothetical protein KFL_001650050 [Klebsormidium nitens]